MKVSYNWLKEYVDFNLTPDQLSEKLTMVGFEVEEVINTLPKFENIVVGNVTKCKIHPDADRLSVCEVQLTNEKFSVICGAPNVKVGQKIPFKNQKSKNTRCRISWYDLLRGRIGTCRKI